MKKTLLALAITFFFVVSAEAASTRVRGHMRDTDGDGVKDTYVQPHQRTSPNSSRTDNYSYPGNYNPNSGELTPKSSSPRENYPLNPNPYERKKPKGVFDY